MSNGEVAVISVKNIYEYVPVNGNVVIDVGANIGDMDYILL